MTRAATIRTFAARLAHDRRGLALIEFAFSLPLLLMAGLYGVEVANLAMINLRISQIALNLADDASRVGNTPLSTQQLREIDINDILQAARYQGASIGLTTHGRVIISSLENVQQSYSDHPADSAAVQRIHWQRCIGLMKGSTYDSTYGSATPLGPTGAGTNTTYANRGTDQVNGMGDAGSMVSAPTGSGVIFVEINYNYQPLLTGYLLDTTKRIHYVASFIVRDNRDFSHIFNPTPSATASTCDKYTS